MTSLFPLILNPRPARGCLRCSAPYKRIKKRAASCSVDEPAAAEVSAVSAGSCVSKHPIYHPHTPSSRRSLSLFPALAWSVPKGGAEEMGLCVLSPALFSAGGSCSAHLVTLWLAGGLCLPCCAGVFSDAVLGNAAHSSFGEGLLGTFSNVAL